MGRRKLFEAGGLVCVNYPGALRSELAPLCFPVSSCGWDGQTAGQADRSPIQGDGKDTNEHPPAARCLFYFSLSPPGTVPRDQPGWPGAWELGESQGLRNASVCPRPAQPGKATSPLRGQILCPPLPPAPRNAGTVGDQLGKPVNGRDGDNGHCCPRRPAGLWGLGGGRWHLQPGPEWPQEVTWETSVLGAGGWTRDRRARSPGHPAATQEDAPVPGVGAHRLRSSGVNEAAWEMGGSSG